MEGSNPMIPNPTPKTSIGEKTLLNSVDVFRVTQKCNRQVGHYLAYTQDWPTVRHPGRVLQDDVVQVGGSTATWQEGRKRGNGFLKIGKPDPWEQWRSYPGSTDRDRLVGCANQTGKMKWHEVNRVESSADRSIPTPSLTP